MHANNEIIRTFYEGFAKFDAEQMASCYHPEVVFTDPAFGRLEGADVMAMWRMLLNRGKPNLKISLVASQADDRIGQASWEAVYLFSMTGREIHNKINAQFKFENGKIIEHIDEFDLHRWASMAFGWKGMLFGGMPFFKKKIRKTANHNLARWKEKQGQSS